MRSDHCFTRFVLGIAVVITFAVPEKAWSQGVTGNTIYLGVSSAFLGHAASLGSDLFRGYSAYFNKINNSGGVHGRKIELVLRDDGYVPEKAVKNTIKLVKDDLVFLLFGNVGTPTTIKVLPLLLKFRDIPIYLYAPFTGAERQRERRYSPYGVNIRASYQQETEALVRHFLGEGKRKIAVFFQNDSYGRSGYKGVKKALELEGLPIAAETTYLRGATFEEDMMPRVEVVRRAGAEAVICIGSYQPCAAFVRDMRRAGLRIPIANISFAGSDAILGILQDQGKQDNRSYTEELYNSEVVPHYQSDYPLVIQYREDMIKYVYPLPPNLKDPLYVPTQYSFISLEGYINAVVFVMALEKAGSKLTSETFMKAIESINNEDIGIGAAIDFGPDDHQGLDRIYLNKAIGGKWVNLR